MIAAIYARKSTEQTGVADEANVGECFYRSRTSTGKPFLVRSATFGFPCFIQHFPQPI